MTDKTRLCIITGSRAEYGLLKPLITLIQTAPEFDLQLIVTGSHLAPALGYTVNEIIQDGFTPNAEVDLGLSEEDPSSVSEASGRATIGVDLALQRLNPDCVIVLGDRYEILAAVQAALYNRIPVAHIHGGEKTLGSLDDSIRHAITKLSHLHFPSTDEYAHRIVQMGEDPRHVKVVGSIALDSIMAYGLEDLREMTQRRGLDLAFKQFILCTYHSETVAQDPAAGVYQLLDALNQFPDTPVLFTDSNVDEGGSEINAAIAEYCAAHSGRAARVSSLGSHDYQVALASAACVLGNSSSGIVEAPSAGTPTVNVGIRQEARLRSPSIIDTECTAAAIESAVIRALSAEFQATASLKQSPFGTPGASRRILEFIGEYLSPNLIIKDFQDIPFDPKIDRR